MWTRARVPAELRTQMSVRVAQERLTIQLVLEETILLRLATGVKQNADGKCGKKPKAIVLHWPSVDCPALDEILVGDAQDVTTGYDPSEGISCLSMLGVGSMNSAKKSIGVG